MRSFIYFIIGVILGGVASIGSFYIYKKYRHSLVKLSFVAELEDRKRAFEAMVARRNLPEKKFEGVKDYTNAYAEFRKNDDRPTLKVKAINFDPNEAPEKVRLKIIHEILSEKYNLEYSDENYDILLNSFFADDEVPPVDPHVVRIYYTGEVFAGDPVGYLATNDLVMGFDFIDHPNYVRVNFGYNRDTDKMRHDYVRPGTCSPENKPYFACMLVSNFGDWLPGKFDGVDARDRMFHRLSLYKKVMSGGLHLNNLGGIVPGNETSKWFSQCKFILAYENNLIYPGNVTEKPYQAWFAGGVPIYNTHKAGLVDINKKAVLYGGDFATEDEFVEYIKKVDNDDKLYCEIWNQQIITDPSKDYEAVKAVLRKKIEEAIAKKIGK